MDKKENSKEEIKKEKTNRKKWLVIPFFFIIVVAIIIGIIIIKMQFEEYKIEEVTDFSYFTLYQSQKYGVIDKKGNVVIEPEYDMIAIPNPSKPLFICYYEYDSQNGEYETKVYNEKREEIFLQYEQVLPLMFQDSTSQVPYEKNILKYKQNDKYGLIDFNGNKITNADYSSIESLLYKEGYLLVEQDGKYGIINGKGKKIIDSKYDTITADGYYNETTKYRNAGFIIGKRTENGYQYGYINYKGDLLLETEYNEVNRVTEILDDNNIYLLAFKNGQAGILKNKKYIVEHKFEDVEYNSKNKLFITQKFSKQGIVNIEGKQILNTEYDSIFISGNKILAQKEDETYVFNIEGKQEEKTGKDELIATENENYFITIDTNEKYGLTNKNGDILVGNEYQYMEYAFGDYFIVTKNGKIGVINSLHEIKVDFVYDVIQKLEDSNVLQAILIKDNSIDLYNKDIEKVSSMKNAVIYQKDNSIKIVSDNDFAYFDNNGDAISNKEILKENNLFAYKQDGKWGFLNKEDQIQIEAKYDMVTEFNEYGFAGIKQNDKWGVINIEGKVIVEPSYTITWQDPQFIGAYCKINFGYGLDYYTNDLND